MMGYMLNLYYIKFPRWSWVCWPGTYTRACGIL